VTVKNNILCENTMSTSKNKTCSTKRILSKSESAEIKTCNESALKSVDENNQESAITSRQLGEKKTVRTPVSTNVNSSMESLLILYYQTKNIEKDLVFFSYGGRPVRDTDTPKSLGLKNGAVIELKYRYTITDQKCLISSDVKD